MGKEACEESSAQIDLPRDFTSTILSALGYARENL